MKLHLKLISSVVMTLLLVACKNDVPNVEDPHNIVIDNQKMTQAAFLEKYCASKSNDENCMKVLQAKQHDSTRGIMPKNW